MDNNSWSSIAKCGWIGKIKGNSNKSVLGLPTTTLDSDNKNEIRVLKQTIINQQHQINILFSEVNELKKHNDVNDAINTVCNALDTAFKYIITYVNKEQKDVRFIDWRHLNQHICRKKRNWVKIDELLTNIIETKFNISRDTFQNDITSCYGIKGARNRKIHPKNTNTINEAIECLNGILSGNHYTETSKKVLNKLLSNR